MIQLNVTNQEKEILADLLKSDLSDLRMEISHTDLREYREKLKTKKAVISKVLDNLEKPVTEHFEDA